MTRSIALLLALGVTATVALADVASAGRSFHEEFHDQDSFEFESLCDVEGLAVLEEWVTDVRVTVVPRGRDGTPYHAEHFLERRVFTNLDNGKTVTGRTRATVKELKVVNNGNGTLTILLLATGNEVLYGADGQAIFRNPGQSRFKILVDHGGTPNDPSDDTFISDQRVKGSTGRTDDFCQAVVPALT